MEDLMSEPTDEDKPEEQEKKKAEWKFRKRLPIQDEMADIIRKTKAAAEAQLALERKKLRKMQYGS